MYLALGCGQPCFRPGSACRAVLTYLPHQHLCTASTTGLSPSPVVRSSNLRLLPLHQRVVCRQLQENRSTPPTQRQQALPHGWFGLLPVRSPLLGESSLFLGVLRCFSSPGALPVSQQDDWIPPAGLPHSDTPGFLAASASPGCFAAWPRPSSAFSA